MSGHAADNEHCGWVLLARHEKSNVADPSEVGLHGPGKLLTLLKRDYALHLLAYLA